MKQFILALLVLTTMGFSAEPVSRTLTDTQGRKIEATLLETGAESVKFRRAADGQEFTLKLSLLSQADREFIAQWKAGKLPPDTAGSGLIGWSWIVEPRLDSQPGNIIYSSPDQEGFTYFTEKLDGKWNRWGLISGSGKLLVNPAAGESLRERSVSQRELTEMLNKERGFPFQRNDVWGVMGLDGQELVPPKWPIGEVDVSYDDPLMTVRLEGKKGYFTYRGEQKIAPRFASATLFQGNYARVRLEPKGKWGIIDRSGKMVTEPRWEEEPRPAWYVSLEGSWPAAVPAALHWVKEGGKWGLYDAGTQTMLAAPTWDDWPNTDSFDTAGLAWMPRSGKYDLVDVTGRIVLGEQEGMIVVNRITKKETTSAPDTAIPGGLWQRKLPGRNNSEYFNRKGEIIPGVVKILHLSGGYNPQGSISAIRRGRVVSEPHVFASRPVIRREGKMALADETGKPLGDSIWDDITQPRLMPAFPAQRDGKWGLLSPEGTVLEPPQWDTLKAMDLPRISDASQFPDGFIAGLATKKDQPDALLVLTKNGIVRCPGDRVFGWGGWVFFPQSGKDAKRVYVAGDLKFQLGDEVRAVAGEPWHGLLPVNLHNGSTVAIRPSGEIAFPGGGTAAASQWKHLQGIAGGWICTVQNPADTKKDLLGLLDPSGKIIMEPELTVAQPPDGGPRTTGTAVLLAQKDGKWGYLRVGPGVGKDTASSPPVSVHKSSISPVPASTKRLNLFNGRTLAGWKVLGNQSSFSVANGAIKGSGKGTSLVFMGDGPAPPAWTDFDLTCQVKTEAKANSGLWLHVSDPPPARGALALEVQIDNESSDVQKTGSLWSIKPVAKAPCQDGRWFALRVIVKGNTVRVFIDNKLVNEWTQPADWQPPANMPEARLGSGTIGLQSNGGEVWFKDIEVTVPSSALSAATPVPATSGTPPAPEAKRATGPEVFSCRVGSGEAQIRRFGDGPKGVVFFSHSGDLARAIRTEFRPHYRELLNEGYSIFTWSYPNERPFEKVQDVLRSGRGNIRFNGVASAVVKAVRENSGLEELCLVGNSLGAGVISWDHKQLGADPKLRFLLISPPPLFMAPLSQLGEFARTVLIAQDNDPFVTSGADQEFYRKHSHENSATLPARGHLIIGETLSHADTVKLVQLAWGAEPLIR